ncbi:MAG: glycosyltransferase family 9 protein [Bacteroidota bacterium]|nr:glycosyltransferase family 9 protein [Bacteroidota bacterium]MDP4230263.1 glycosyltransferase family 9 protein [Bacteroidota bacterium]MDP4236109.1 glycosyltransferase family 9 protein [Bacteroidota bacterium]
MIKRILIIRPDKIGDLVLTLPMATVIKEKMPEAVVSFLVQAYNAPLLDLATDVDERVIYDTNSSLWKTVSLLRSTKTDAIFFFGSKFTLTLAAFIARIPVRVGRAYWWYSFLYNKKIYEHRKTAERNEAEYNIRMLQAIGVDPGPTPLPRLDHSKLPNVRLPVTDYVVFHVTTGGSTRPWSEEHFVDLALKMKQQYDSALILTGVPADREFLLRIAERMKHSLVNVHITCSNTLLELAAILAGARLVVACGTGPGHLAAALGTPAIGLFPNVVSLSKERWGFRGLKAENISPRVLPKPDCPQCKDCTCIDEITVAQVMETINDLNIY